MCPEKCTTEGCIRNIHIKKRGLCRTCYRNWWLDQDPDRRSHRRALHRLTRLARYRALDPSARSRLYKGTVCSPKYQFSASKNAARTRGIPWTLTLTEYTSLVQKPCFYCEQLMNDQITGKLDRINNDKSVGYVWGNVLPCCKVCNWVRGDHYTVEETKTAVMAVMELRARKSQGTT